MKQGSIPKGITMKFTQEMLRLNSFIEAHLYFYLMDRFSLRTDKRKFRLWKRIPVFRPFGNIKKRNNGISNIKPEIFAASKSLCLVAEAAAWDDDRESANRQSESHKAMYKIGLRRATVYFAQKVMCQVFPIFLNGMKYSNKCFPFISVTQNHKAKMEEVLNALKANHFLQNYNRPLKSRDRDIKKYYQVIFQLNFPHQVQKITKRLQKLGK